jgi:putative ABC transport system permease protein
MMLRLALKSLWNRRLTTGLTIFSIALSAALLLSVEKIKRASEEGFTQTISQVDLIVGARSSPINLLLYTVFNIGSATNNISMATYEHFKKHPAVDWVIPYSLGDGHRGHRVVGTDETFFTHYRFRGHGQIELQEGGTNLNLWNVVIGAEVAKNLDYKLGQQIVVAHGVTSGEGILKHDDKPCKVTGIMKPTGTALDQSLYMSLETLEALHVDWKNGGMPNEKNRIAQDQIKAQDLKPKSITSFFLRTKSRIETLRLQREINDFDKEPLLAIIPGVTLNDLWRSLGYIEQAFKIISWLVVLVGLTAMMVSLLSGLNERRREMAILRALGAGTKRIAGLLVFESGLLSLAGVLTGFLLQFLVVLILSNWIEKEFGLVISAARVDALEFFYMAMTFVLGLIIGLIPAIRAQSQALKDGLSVRI